MRTSVARASPPVHQKRTSMGPHRYSTGSASGRSVGPVPGLYVSGGLQYGRLRGTI